MQHRISDCQRYHGDSFRWSGRLRAPCGQAAATTSLPYPMADTPFIMPVVQQPETVRAADATTITDDAQVVGVTAGNQHRAHAIKTLTAANNHVINDLIEGVPMTVTYCDRTGHVRCLTSTEQVAALDLQVGGFKNGQMLL